MGYTIFLVCPLFRRWEKLHRKVAADRYARRCYLIGQQRYLRCVIPILSREVLIHSQLDRHQDPLSDTKTSSAYCPDCNHGDSMGISVSGKNYGRFSATMKAPS